MFVLQRLRDSAARIPPPARRVLLHSGFWGLGVSIADLLFNFYLVSLGYGNDTVGIFATLMRLAGVIAGLPIGLAIDRLGPRNAILLGASLYTTGWAVLIAVPALPIMLAAQFVVGACHMMTVTATVPLLSLVVSADRRAAIFGFNASAGLIVGLLGSAVAGILPALAGEVLMVGPQATEAYRLALTSVVALSVLAIIPITRGLPQRSRDEPGVHSRRATTDQLPVWLILRYALPAFLLGIAGGALLPFQNLYFRQEFALDDAQVGLVLAVTSLVMGLGAAFSGALAHRLGLKRAAWSLRTLAAPAMALMIIPALPFALIGFLVRGFFVASSYPINDALVMQMTPSQQRGAMMSVTSILWSLGWATSAAVSGMTQDAVGFTPAIIASCIAFVLSGLTIYTYRAPSFGIPADAEPQHSKDVA